jgi:hypothetical protein
MGRRIFHSFLISISRSIHEKLKHNLSIVQKSPPPHLAIPVGLCIFWVVNFLLMGLVIAARGWDSHDSSSVIIHWDSYFVAFVIPMMQFQSDLKECVEF